MKCHCKKKISRLPVLLFRWGWWYISVVKRCLHRLWNLMASCKICFMVLLVTTFVCRMKLVYTKNYEKIYQLLKLLYVDFTPSPSRPVDSGRHILNPCCDLNFQDMFATKWSKLVRFWGVSSNNCFHSNPFSHFWKENTSKV